MAKRIAQTRRAADNAMEDMNIDLFILCFPLEQVRPEHLGTSPDRQLKLIRLSISGTFKRIKTNVRAHPLMKPEPFN